jgi:hypothetical protein
MAHTMYAHMNKWINNKKMSIRRILALFPCNNPALDSWTSSEFGITNDGFYQLDSYWSSFLLLGREKKRGCWDVVFPCASIKLITPHCLTVEMPFSFCLCPQPMETRLFNCGKYFLWISIILGFSSVM